MRILFYTILSILIICSSANAEQQNVKDMVYENNIVGPYPLNFNPDYINEKNQSSKEAKIDNKSSDKAIKVTQQIDKKISDNYIKNILKSQGEYKVSDVIIDKNSLKKIYKNYDYQTIWFKDNVVKGITKKAIKFLSLAEENGLSKDEINVKLVQERIENDKPEIIKNTDLLITHLIIKMINQIGNGISQPEDVGIESYNISPERVKNISSAFDEFYQSENIDDFISKYSPKKQEYKNLKVAIKKLIEERDSRENVFPKINQGPDVLPGGRDYRMVEIAKRFGNPSTINQRAKDDKFIYYKELQRPVIEFQKKFGIKPNGIINNKTIQALNVDENDLIKKIAVNMDRLRWIPDNLEPKRLEINIANQTLTAYEDDKQAFTQALVIGRSEKKTAIMNTYFKTIIFNPFWHAPRGYTTNFLLPIIRKDRSYLETEELELIQLAPDGWWKPIDASTIDFKKINEKNINFVVRQKPGRKNALGPMRFSLINNFDIYMHGTAEPWLFSSDYRAQSSGCIRVEDPLKLALFALEDNTDTPKEKYMSYYEAFNDDKLPSDKLPKHIKVDLKESLPTYINYFSVYSDEQGNLKFSDDIYSWDKEMIEKSFN
ncbi:MAG: L,D-transpeptidase family protein [Rickettsiales bacterium]|nr:L,D-transpeptidase family protein [Rickettsiales bacterium]